MDKHERPYRCDRPECSKLNGFTYSGGLLRHQREVHKMHGSTAKLFCPEPNCKRASGSGFTRKENLHEHLRRVHRRSSMAAQEASSLKTQATQAQPDGSSHQTVQQSVTPIKRNHSDDEDEEDASDPNDEIRTLRQQIGQRDVIIRDQRDQIQHLKDKLESLGSRSSMS